LDGEQAVLAVHGGIDISGASKLGVFFDAVIASGCLSVVLDLAELDLMDLAGLRAIAFATSRLVASGGEVTIRSLAPLVARTLDVTWLGGLIALELTGPARERLGTEQSVTAPGTPVRGGAPSSVHGSRQVTAILADDDVVDGALRLVVELARATVVGADGVSVSLRRHGRLTTVAASDQTISEMDAHQYATGEGPCVDASLNGHWFHVESLDQETRWPAFVPRAKKLGINAILSTPLMAQSHPVGALNIYSRTPAVFTAKDQELASVFAIEASAILTHAGADVSDDELARRQREALAARRVVALAEGVMMEREGVGPHEAFTILRRFSQRAGRPLIERAEDVVASTRRPEPDLSPKPERAILGERSPGELDQARREAGLSRSELWLRYFELGGMSTALEMEAFLFGALQPGAHDHDVIAQALNESHVEHARNRVLIPYSDDERLVPEEETVQ
jgi:anti-anti-sigma factor